MRTFFDSILLRSCDTRSLALLRIGIGLILSLFYMRILPDFVRIFSHFGHGEYFFSLHLPTVEGYRLISWMILLFSILLTLGLFTRATILIVLVLHTWIGISNPYVFWAWHLVIRLWLVFLLLSDSHRTLSLDVKLGRVSPKKQSPAWMLFLFQGSVCCIYFLTTLHRFFSPDWLRGETLFYILNHGLFSRLSFVDWSPYWSGLRLASYAGLCLEALGAFLLVMGRYRLVLALALMGLHFTLEPAERPTAFSYSLRCFS